MSEEPRYVQERFDFGLVHEEPCVKDIDEAVDKLAAIKAKGYVSTHRSGPTGIGKTLEDLLGIAENNIAISDTAFAELKSARKNSPSMLTLFTKSPMPPKANSQLLSDYGYPSPEDGEKILHTTTDALRYNTLKGKAGFKISVQDGRVALLSSNATELCYWSKDVLKQSFEKKLFRLLYVLADSNGAGSNERFWFNEAWLLTGFSFEGFASAVNAGTVCVDIRIGQYADGRTHDHGTGFRVTPENLKICFKDRRRLL